MIRVGPDGKTELGDEKGKEEEKEYMDDTNYSVSWHLRCVAIH
jgi:hypothetical protein